VLRLFFLSFVIITFAALKTEGLNRVEVLSYTKSPVSLPFPGICYMIFHCNSVIASR
jgi:hypothetical protein